MATIKTVGPLGTTSNRNLLAYSEQFDNAYWTKLNITVTADATANPIDGLTNTAELVTESTDGAASSHELSRAFTFTNGATYTYSFYAKAVNRQAAVRVLATGEFAGAVFNLGTGTVASTTAGSASITNVGGGWYRCVVTGVCAGTSGFVIHYTVLTGTKGPPPPRH